MEKQQQDDQVLVKAAQKGELEAFEKLVKKYQRSVLSFVRKMNNDNWHSEDIVQETFIAIYKNLRKIDSSRKFSTYLFEIAKNNTISHWRKIHKEVPLDFAKNIETGENMEEAFDKRHTQERVRSGLKLLPEKYQKVLRLYYFEELDYKNISSILKLPLNTIRTLLKRGKEKLNYYLKHF